MRLRTTAYTKLMLSLSQVNIIVISFGEQGHRWEPSWDHTPLSPYAKAGEDLPASQTRLTAWSHHTDVFFPLHWFSFLRFTDLVSQSDCRS